MAYSHAELMDKLIPLYERDSKRFMRFYDAVYLKLTDLPPGGALRIAEHCRAEDIGLFVMVANLVIIEELNRKDVLSDYLEPSDDWTMIRRFPGFIPSVRLHPFKKRV